MSMTLYLNPQLMSTYSPTIFNQLFLLVRDHFRPLLGQLKNTGRKFNQESLLKVLMFAQATGKTSLRDIETGMQANESKLYHLGIKSFARSTVSYWNNKTDSSLYEQLFYNLYESFKGVVWWGKKDIWIKCIAMDSSLISLSLWMFDRAKYRTSKGGVRIHVGLELSEYLPSFCVITDWKKGDNKVAQNIVQKWMLRKWEMIVFDRYYVDLKLREMINNKESYFVTRTKKNTNFTPIEFLPVIWKNITYDAKVELLSSQSKKKYKETLRVVRFYDEKEQKEYEYITNNFDLSAEQIANIYKNRREIEVFFRWIKQNLKIKTFLGTSENAVKNQIWIALIYYLILRYLTESVKLGRNQLLKFMRLIAEKILEAFPISEIYVICKSRTSRCLSCIDPVSSRSPPNTLFS